MAIKTEKEIREKREEIQKLLDNDEGSYRENDAVENALSWVLGDSDEI